MSIAEAESVIAHYSSTHEVASVRIFQFLIASKHAVEVFAETTLYSYENNGINVCSESKLSD